MQIFIHRVNTIERLGQVPIKYGIEIDIRANWSNLILNHEPFQWWENLEEFLEHYHHNGIILNIKEAGIENRVLELMKKNGIKNYFLLDVEFPYVYKVARRWIRDIAMRYSEDECIETVLKYKWLVDWVWIDTNTQLALNKDIVEKLQGFKTCLVCPERWWRPQDIKPYKQKMKELNFKVDAVMTALEYADIRKKNN
jgi:hypothetical protein